ncbi:hypothetical protein [Neobacillus sp. SuZ13]|nr:hypothetical protein [Neobacillus sp. SuZ13]WHY69656.1 hypothetical protein QNH17_13905 [Neobacillus sp. SuZ13]
MMLTGKLIKLTGIYVKNEIAAAIPFVSQLKKQVEEWCLTCDQQSGAFME